MAFTLDSITPQAEKAPDPSAGGGEISIGPLRTGIRTPEWLDRGLAGTGSSLMDLKLGFDQILGRATSKDAEEKRRRDAPLLNTTAGAIGQFAGQVLPAVAVPATGVLGATALGAAQGALQPTTDDESRLLNAAGGGAAGAAGAGAAKLVGKVAAPFKNALSPEEQALAGKASSFGIDLTPGQATGNKFLRVAESQLERLPGSAEKATAAAQGQRRQFTQALLKQAGAEGDSMSPAIMADAKARLGQEYQALFAGKQIDSSLFAPRVTLIRDEAVRMLPPDKARVVVSHIQDLAGKVDQKTGAIDGTAYQKWRSTLRSSDGDTSRYLKAVREAVDDGAAGSLGPDAMQAFERTNLKYKNLKTMQPLAEKSTDGTASPALLLEHVRAANPDMAFTGAGEMGDLARIGKAFLKEPPNSETAARTLAQQLMTGQALMSGGVGIGAGAATGDPLTALKAAGGTYASAMLGPKLAQALLNSQAGRSFIERGVGQDVNPMLLEALKRGSVALPVATSAEMMQ